MISRIHLSTLIFIAALVWAVLLIIQGVSVTFSFFRWFSTVVGVLVVLIGVFDRWAWHLPILHPWFVSQPDLRGTWKGQLFSTWTDPKAGSSTPPIDGYLVIRQTFSSIQMMLFTNESSSELVSSSVLPEANGGHVVAGIYRNTPRLLKRAGSPIHHGGILLHVRGSPPQVLEGEYWTDRDTKGELRFTGRSNRILPSFEAATAAKYKSAK